MPREFNFETAPYKVKYIALDARLIYNHLELSKAQQLQQEKEQQFFSKLERSILTEGFRNPISVALGKRIFDLERSKPDQPDLFHFKKSIVLPRAVPYVRDEIVYYCAMHGGSRLMIGQKHNLKIPCLVADFWDHLPEAPLTSYEEMFSKFRDRPQDLRLREWGVFVESLPHYHLK